MMGRLLLLGLLLFVTPATFAQTVERAADGTPVAVTVDGTRYAVITITEKRQALIDQAELEKQRQLNALKDQQIADKDKAIGLHRAQFADCMKIVDLQRVSLDQANSIIKAGVPPKRSKILTFLENPITVQVVKFAIPFVADAVIRK